MVHSILLASRRNVHPMRAWNLHRPLSLFTEHQRLSTNPEVLSSYPADLSCHRCASCRSKRLGQYSGQSFRRVRFGLRSRHLRFQESGTDSYRAKLEGRHTNLIQFYSVVSGAHLTQQTLCSIAERAVRFAEDG